MTRTERRLLVDTVLIGAILTCIVAALDYGGFLATPEYFFYDQRAKHCQFFQPPPTDKLVHLDIDDRALDAVGAWPWPRSKLAEIVDEVNLAGTKALDLDIIFPEPQAAGYEEVESGIGFRVSGIGKDAEPIPETRYPEPDSAIFLRRIDNDAALAAALRRCGRVLVPVTLELRPREAEPVLLEPMVAELTQDLALSPDQILQRLRSRGLASSLSVADIAGPLYTAASREAMFQRISAELLADPKATEEQLRAKLLPHLDRDITGSPLLRLLHAQRERFAANLALRRFGRPIPPGIPPLLASEEEGIDIALLMESAAFTGFVDYVPLRSDGVVRSVPLWAVHHGLMYPQMGLALACAMLDVDPKSVRITPDRVIIPAPAGDIAIPIHGVATARGRVGTFFDIPWFGTDNWETIFDYPKHQTSKQHLSLSYVWEACQVRHRIERNNRSIDGVLATILENNGPQTLGLDPELAKKYFGSLPRPDDTAARRKIAADYIDLFGQIIEDLVKKAKDEKDRQQIAGYRYSHKLLQECLDQNDALKKDLDERRAELRTSLAGRAAIVGWVAAGAIADVVPTPLHARCPGVVVHGVIFNAIMTRHFWYAAPAWVNILITLAMGLLATALVAVLSPPKAFSAMLLLIAGYLALNGIYLFDKRGMLVGVAGPVTAAAGVWAFCTLIRYILEQSFRKRIHRNFQTYVDEKLVRYLLDNDDRLDGKVKELTVVFTDLGNFTKISEQLGERTVPLLNEYMGLMVPIIRSHNGTLNKFLGDGIMFFFGAPYENAAHTYDAIRSMLAMQEAMVGFNQSLAQRGLPQLVLRGGITSGSMIVGNAGLVDRYDYTVLGDTVNLAARLEPANKLFGTSILVNGRARELAGDDRILFRPIAKIQAVGQSEGVMTHEPLCLLERADERQKKLAEMMTAVVTPFLAGDFQKCLDAIDEFERVFERSKLTVMYRELCDNYLREPPPADFDGRILQTAK